MKSQRLLVPLLVLALLFTSCAQPTPPGEQVVTIVSRTAGTAAEASASPVVVAAGDGTREEGMGFRFRLSEGVDRPDAPVRPPVASGIPLPEEQVQSLLNRLPPLAAEPDDARDFALPERSLPAPVTGETVDLPFPPPAAPEVPELPAPGPLEVLRYAPEGDVPLAPYLSVTFSQPMIELTAHADLADRDVPVRLSPHPAGSWRWVGTKTLLFEPEVDGLQRFPMATTYTVEVPAGTTSAIGGELRSAVRWTFTTPDPQVRQTHPDAGPWPRDPLMFVAFDQRIDPQAVLATIEVKAAGRSYQVRLATAEEVQADEQVSRLVKDTLEGRWLAFRATESFPTDTEIVVTIGPGTPSAEGPLRTMSAHTFKFRTYGPLRVTEHGCSYWDQQCPPLTPWYIYFNNPLDTAAFHESYVQVDPAVPGFRAELHHSALNLQGQTQGRTTYKVTLSAALRDVFGQTLERDHTLTFNVGSAPEAFYAPGGTFIVVDPYGRPTYSVFTINYSRLNVQMYAVTVEDWNAFQTYQRTYYRGTTPPTPPGRQIVSQSVQIDAPPDTLVETAIDLSPALEEGLGHVIVLVQPEAPPLASLFRPGPLPSAYAWIQATNIALDAFVDNTKMVAWANSLRDGVPLPGVELQLMPDGQSATTDQTGLATLSLPTGRGANLLVARLDDDVAILAENAYAWWGEGDWQGRKVLDELRWYVFDDRAMYRPGEEVHVKGWIRRLKLIETGDIGLAGDAATQVRYQLMDARGNEIARGSAPLNALGGFHMSFTLPTNMNLGQAWLYLEAENGFGAVEGRSYSHAIQVQEFRRPEFEVTTTASPGPHFVGGHADVSVSAKYFAGGPLPNAEVNWRVSASPGQFTPPNWDDFTFGTWTPWWMWEWREPFASADWAETYQGYTDAAGAHHLRIDFDSITKPQPVSVRAEATVIDINRQAWTAASTLLVHPADLYVGLRAERWFVDRRQPLHVDVVVVDLDGNPLSDRPISVQAVRTEWRFVRGSWQEQDVESQECQLQSAARPVRCTFEPEQGGRYRIIATIQDDQGRANQSKLTVWVSGGESPPAREVTQEEATLIPDRSEYQPGDTAEVLVQTPFYPAEGLFTLRRNGIIHTERFTMDGPSHTLRVPITENHVPNVHVQVDLVGAAARTNDRGEAVEGLPQRPAYASGSLNLPVPPWTRKLSVEVAPRDKALEPGGTTVVDLVLRDAQGQPVSGAEVAVVVVDEAILALTNYQIIDPLSVIYREHWHGTRDYHSRSFVVLVSPDELAEQTAVAERSLGLFATAAAPEPAAPMEAPAAEADFAYEQDEAAAEPIHLRTDFNPLAVFAPEVPTDDQGRAQIEVKLPDNLTRYRVMAIAVAGEKQFGFGESTITGRLPLMVRPSPPRFLNFGDRFELPIVVQNQTDTPLEVEVAVQVTNLELLAGNGQQVTVPANDRVEVRFPATTVQPGTARFQVGVASGEWADAAQFELPVWTPATTEAFATYGELDHGATFQPVRVPSDAFTQFGGLEITTSSTALQALTDAVLYLAAYPFECSEQLASRILAVAALRDVLSAFAAEGLPAPEELVKAVERDIEQLRGLQNPDGGFALWRRGADTWPYTSIHVAHALQRARQKGFQVPEEMLSRSLNYLRNIERHIPSNYGQKLRHTLVAYSLYVRKQMGDVDTARARQLVNNPGLGQLAPEAIGWLLYVLTDDPNSVNELTAIRRHLGNRVVETAGAAHFVTSYTEGESYLLMHSDRRADGVILESLIIDNPDSDLIPKLVRGLLAHRKQGRWSNTQENVFILLALDRYFNTFEAQTPDFVARIWLGDQYAGEATFRGRTTERQQINVPMSYLAEVEDALQNLIVSKEGPGRLYYRLGMTYAPTSLDLDPADHGFTVERVYEAVDDPEDVWRDEDGTWHVKAGARVRVRITMVAPARRYHVALVDPLPAGLEALNPALAVTGTIPQDPEGRSSGYDFWWWWGPWYEHQNLRDERAEAFASLLWEGVHTYSYVARATTPGDFVVPPAKAEEMYAPETFGRSASDRVVVQ